MYAGGADAAARWGESKGAKGGLKHGAVQGCSEPRILRNKDAPKQSRCKDAPNQGRSGALPCGGVAFEVEDAGALYTLQHIEKECNRRRGPRRLAWCLTYITTHQEYPALSKHSRHRNPSLFFPHTCPPSLPPLSPSPPLPPSLSRVVPPHTPLVRKRAISCT